MTTSILYFWWLYYNRLYHSECWKADLPGLSQMGCHLRLPVVLASWSHHMRWQTSRERDIREFTPSFLSLWLWVDSGCISLPKAAVSIDLLSNPAPGPANALCLVQFSPGWVRPYRCLFSHKNIWGFILICWFPLTMPIFYRLSFPEPPLNHPCKCAIFPARTPGLVSILIKDCYYCLVSSIPQKAQNDHFVSFCTFIWNPKKDSIGSFLNLTLTQSSYSNPCIFFPGFQTENISGNGSIWLDFVT